MSEIEFRPVGELDETGVRDVVIDRRTHHWPAVVADAVEQAIDDEAPMYLVEDGRRIAVIMPRESMTGTWPDGKPLES